MDKTEKDYDGISIYVLSEGASLDLTGALQLVYN
jgi:hypothetical protein